jgi:two-component system sensor histidine kinase/response regulator
MTELKKNIYVVDDIQENIQVIGNVLINNGLNISIARNGEQALKGIKRKLPDLVLLDVSMPGMDGFEVCKRLKDDDETAGIPIIFLTARTQTEDIVTGFKAGGVDYITKPFNTEELLSRVFTHLELKESRDTIKEQNQLLKELNTTKDKFFRIIAHDLKSAFNQLLGFSSLLFESSDKSVSDEVRELSYLLNKSAKNTFKLLENLLSWARFQSGHIKFKPDKLSIFPLVADNLELLKERAENKHIELINEVSDDFYIWADRNMINTIIRNLVTNAIKFTPEKGKITLKAEKKANYIIISVIDTGIGISKETLPKLFRLEFQDSIPGTNDEKGTGLGLVICKEFIEKHKGSIRVESEVGKGSTFSFSIPGVD